MGSSGYLKTVVEFVEGNSGVIKKQAVTKLLNTTVSSIVTEVLPTIDELYECTSTGKLPDNIFRTVIGVYNANNPKDKISTDEMFVSRLGVFFRAVVGMSEAFKSKCIGIINNAIDPKNCTIRDAAILKVVSDFTFMTLFVNDFIYFYLARHDVNDTTFPKKRQELVGDTSIIFVDMLSKYIGIKPDIFMSELIHLPDNIIDDKFDESYEMMNKIINERIVVPDDELNVVNEVVDAIDVLTGKTPLPAVSSFNANIIYHVRMWFVDRDIEKYDELKTKKSLVLYKLEAIKQRANGVNTPELDKQIQYNEKRISEIEFELSNIRS